MRGAGLPLIALVSCFALGLAVQSCAQDVNPYPNPPTGIQPAISASDTADWPPTDPNSTSSGPTLDMMVTRSMLYAAGIKHHVNPYLVMGLAWHESGWQVSVVSSAGAVGIMQVMPATAAVDGPKLLNRVVNLYDPGDNIEMGTAILKHNLDGYNNDLAKALCAYYAGGAAVTEWSHMRADCRRYVWAVYNAAKMFADGKGPA